MALFTTKKLTDSERQVWSAQLLEVRLAELERFGELPTQLGNTWEENDAEYNRLYAFEYYPKYGFQAHSVMHDDGLRLSGYREYVFEVATGGMILLADELEDMPSEMSPGEVYWIVNSGEFDEDGAQIWGFQFISTSWKYAKSSMIARVKEWDLENKRNQLNWSKFFNFAALAILAIITFVALWPVVGQVLLGVALGETITLSAALGAATAALTGAYASNRAWIGISNVLSDEFGVDVDSEFIDASSQFNQGDSVLVFVGNELTERMEAPLNPPELQTGGMAPMLLAAAALLLFL